MTVAMFRRIGLEKNLENTKTMVCTPGFIWGKWGACSYKRQVTGEGYMFQYQNRLWVSWAECGVMVAQNSLKHHMSSQHRICIPQTRGVDEKG